MIQPRFGVLTSIGREHLEYLEDLSGVAREEGWVAELLPPDGKLFVNGESPQIERVIERTRARVVRAGLNQDNDWHGRVTRMGPDGTVFAVSSPVAGLSGEYRMPLIGRHQVVNALLAMAVAAEFGLTRDQVQRGLAACKPPKMRLEFVEARGVRVLDDSYNANTDSMRAALDALRELAGACPTIAVLGDMAELGRASQDAHAEVGAHAARLGIGCLVAVGRMAPVMGQAARENGLSNVREYDDADQAADGLRELARPGDFVLVKASRATALERIVNRMRD
jgi:UDP-N-acetylmuramoyl-tripeptide--D-alanyl-D-alanine ligase